MIAYSYNKKSFYQIVVLTYDFATKIQFLDGFFIPISIPLSFWEGNSQMKLLFIIL